MILETSYLVDLLLGDPKAAKKARELVVRGEVIRIPTPAAFELWEGVERSDQGKAEAAKVREFLDAHEIIPFNEGDAREAGRISGRLVKQGKTPGTVDVQIAGMTKARGETLLTADEGLLALVSEIRVERYR